MCKCLLAKASNYTYTGPSEEQKTCKAASDQGPLELQLFAIDWIILETEEWDNTTASSHWYWNLLLWRSFPETPGQYSIAYMIACLTSRAASCDWSLVTSDLECSLAYFAMSESSWVLCSLSSFWIYTDRIERNPPCTKCWQQHVVDEVLTFSCIVSLMSAALLSASATLPCSCTRWWACSKFSSDNYGIFKC